MMSVDWNELLHKVASGENVYSPKFPTEGVYAHQQMAIDRYATQSEIALFFDPGTGKTRTTLEIAKLQFKYGVIDAVLVIAPNGVHKQWAIEEIPKWCKDVETTVQWRKNKKDLFWVEGKLNFVCTNIDQFSTVSTYKKYVEWALAHKTMIVVDEATKIKNPKATRTQRLLYEFNEVTRKGRSIVGSIPKTVSRAVLTGTPVTNGPFDVWSVFEFLRPGYFGCNYYAFQNKYGLFYTITVPPGRNIRVLINEHAWNEIKACDTYDQAATLYGCSLSTFDTIKQQETYQGPYRNVEELRKKMCEVAMFVRIQDCNDMPEKSYHTTLLDMGVAQAKVYNDMEQLYIAKYKDRTTEATAKIVAYIRLQQIASGFIASWPEDYDPTEEELEDPTPVKADIIWFDEQPKIKRLLDYVKEIGSEQLIVVTHFAAEAGKIYDELCDKFKCCLITGWKKVGSIDAFKEGKYQVMIANEKVISMGFNLQNCHRMLFYSNTFSLEDRLQTEARIWRTGQKNHCLYEDFVMVNTIDMKTVAALQQKKSLSDYVRDKSVEQMLTEIDDVFMEQYKEVVF